jgi:hypothetical protein
MMVIFLWADFLLALLIARTSDRSRDQSFRASRTDATVAWAAMIAGATSSAFASISMLSLQVESTGRCCIWTIRGRLKLGPLSLDQIAKARSSNATVNRWPAGTSAASS